jgi:hypothetical protein
MTTRRELLEAAALLSGDEGLIRVVEHQQKERAGNRTRKASIGNGFILDSATGQVTRDPNYAEYEQGRDTLESSRRAQLQEDMLSRLGLSADLRAKQPRYTAQETEGGVAPVQINPNARGGARAEPTIPVRRPISDTDSQKAAEAERLAAEARDLYGELERVQGAVSSPKDIASSVINKLPLVGAGASQAAQERLFSPDQLSVKTRGANFEQNLSNLAAGLSLTGFEIEQRNRWSPFASGISQGEAQRRLENIERNFTTRGGTIRNANRPRNPNGLSRNEWLEPGNPDDGTYSDAPSLSKPKRVKVDAQGNVLGN